MERGWVEKGMIGIFDALEWLNQFESSHLNLDSQDWLADSYRINAKSREVSARIIQILDCSRSAPDLLDYPEALLNVGGIEFNRGWEDEAEDHLLEAYTLYPPDSHRRAVTAWILGIVEWQRREYESAHFHWQEALAVFMKLTDFFSNLYEPVKKEWYIENVKCMGRDLTSKVPEIFGWLKVFEPFHMTTASVEVKNLIICKIKKNQLDSANLLLRESIGRSHDHADVLETPEILVECALAAYYSGNIFLAMELTEKAVARFSPRSHTQAVARWMLGVLQFQIPKKREKACRSCERALVEFEDLATKADYDNNPSRLAWYREKKELMGLALREKLKEAYAG